MSAHLVWRGAWALAVLAALGGAASLVAALRPWPPAVRRARAPADSTPSVVPVALGALDSALVMRDPFRPARRPAAVAFDPAPATEVSQAPPPPKPALVLTGLLWGADPAAVVEGLPGAEGPRVGTAGDTLAGLRVRRIMAHSVLITGMDTTWTLTVRQPW